MIPVHTIYYSFCGKFPWIASPSNWNAIKPKEPKPKTGLLMGWVRLAFLSNIHFSVSKFYFVNASKAINAAPIAASFAVSTGN